MLDCGCWIAHLLLVFLSTVLLRPATAAVRADDVPNASKVLLAQARHRDTTPPVLVLTTPSEGAVVTDPTIPLRGTVTDEGAVTVWVEGRRVPVRAGAFAADVSLRRGPNQIEVEAIDATGNRTRISRQVRFEDLRRIEALVPPVLVAVDLPTPGHLTLAPDGAILVTAPQAGRIYRVPGDGSPPRLHADHLRDPLGIAAVGDGSLFVAERGADRILRLAPDGTRAVILDRVDDPRGLALGREGSLFITANRWRATGPPREPEAHRGVVVRLDLATGAARVVAEGLVAPEGIVAGGEDAEESLWVVAERRQGEPERQDADLFRITLTGTVTPIPGPHLWRPLAIARDALGSVWLTARRQYATPDDMDDGDDDEWERGVLFKVSAEGLWQRFATHLDEASGLAFAAQGDLLVVEADRGRILRFRAPPAPEVIPPLPTSAPTVTLTGTAEPLAMIVARGLAGTGTGPTDAEGRFQVSVPLLPGQANRIEVFAVAAAGVGLASAPTVITTVQESAPLALVVETPPPDALTNGSPIPVRGRVSGGSLPNQVFVNEAAVALDPAGGFATTFALLEGPNEVRVRVVDAQGKTATDTRSVTLDTVPPRIVIASPTEGGLVTGSTVTVTGTLLDAYPPATLSVNGQSAPLSAGGQFSAEIPLPLTQTTVTVAAIDRAGNAASVTRRVVRDATPPLITIVSPTAGFLTNQPSIPVSGTVTDAGTIAEVTVNGQPVVLTGTTFTASVILAEGANIINVTARDAAGNSGTASVGGTLDTGPPTLTLAAAPPDPTNSRTLALSVSATDAVTPAEQIQFAFSLDSETGYGSYAAVSTASFDVTADGPHTIRIKARDQAGNESPALAVTVRVNTVPPAVAISSPTPAFLTNQASMTVTGAVNASSALTGVTVNGQAAALVGNLFTAVVALAEGPNTITVTARDAAGNLGTATVAGTLDTTAPTITITAPATGFLTNQPAVTVIGTVTATGTIAEVTVNGQGVTLTGMGFSRSLVLGEGANTITVTARDMAGNTGTATVSGSLDTLPPVLTITAPAADSVLNTTPLTVTGTVSETVTSLTVNGVAASVSAGTFSVRLTPTRGRNTLMATAADPAGNVGTATRSFIFDDVAPIVRILTPTSGQILSQTSLTVTGSVDDATATVTVNGVPAAVQGGLFTASGVLVSAGPVTVTAQATDAAGNVGTAQITFTVDSTPPTLTALTVPGEVTAGTAVTLAAEVTDNLGLAAVDLLVDGRLVASGTTSPVSTSFTIPPDKAVNETLTVTARAVDVAGQSTTQLAMMRVTGAAVGPGFLRGLVLDDTKGLPLAGATVSVTVEGAPPVDPQITGADGQYAFSVDPGTAVVRITKDGTTAVERKVPVRSDLLSTAADARLTPRDAAVAVLGTAGGVAADTANALRLTLSADALTEDASITLTPVSAQGLIARLPLGWTPILVADIAPASVSVAAPGTLSVRVPEAWQALLPAATAVTAARYDPAQGWVALDAATVTNDGLAIEAAVSVTGQVAFLLPDATPQAPPTAVAGQPLAAVAAAVIPEDATAVGAVAPAAIPPGTTIATGQVTVTPTAPLPSGTLVQAVVSEKYTLLTGEEVTPPSFTQELVLYQCEPSNSRTAEQPNSSQPSCGSNVLAAVFPVTPSRTYTLKDLAIGTVHVALQTPETGGQGTIIGPEGGTITAADGTILTIPARALTRETVVAFASLAESDLRVAVPAGFQVLKAIILDLTRATLALSAELAFPLPAGITGDTQVLVARVLEADGVLRLQAVGVGQVSGGLLCSKGTVSGVSLPGITSDGTYVALRATTPVGFVAGTITDAASATKAGILVSSSTGLVDVSRGDGRYLVAVAAGSATITATDRATGQGASQAVTVGSSTGTTQPIQVQVIPPTVVSVTPAATSRNVPVNSTVTVTFSQAIAKASLTASSLVLSSPTGPVEATITLSPLGTEATLYPSKALVSQTTYSLVASQAIQDTHGMALPAPFTSQFTTANAPPPPPPAGAITVSFPDEQGNVTVTATQGTAPPDYLIVVLNVSSGTVASATVGANGGFSTSLFAMLGDELLVMIQDSAGNQTVVSPGPYRSADGQFVLTRSGGTLDTAEGISLTLAPSAVSQPVTLKVTPLTLDQVVAAIPTGLQFLGGLRLDTQGASFKTGTKVSLPIPSGVTIPTGAQPFLARLQSINGQLTPVLVDTLRVATGKLMSASPPFPGVQKDGDYVALLPTNPYPAVVTGTVVRDGTTPAQPIAGAVLKVDSIEVAATTDDKGNYALELFTTDTTRPTTFNLVALDPTSGALRGATLTVPAWTVPAGGGTYTLDVALPSAGAGRDTTPPKVELAVDAPSLKGGRVALGDTVTVTVKVTDDIGVRADTLTLTKNGTSHQLTLGGASSSSTTSFVPTTPWEVITIVATAQDTSGNVGRSETTIQVAGGGIGGGGDVPPPAPPEQPLLALLAGIYPAKGDSQIDIGTNVIVPFSQPVVNATSDFIFVRETNLDTGVTQIIYADVQTDPSNSSTVWLKPKNRLRYRASYTLVIKTGLQGAGGGHLMQDIETEFKTMDLAGPIVPITNAKDVVILDKYGIVLDRTDGLVTVDLSDPTKPVKLETTQVFTGSYAANQAFALASDFAYLNSVDQPVVAPAVVAVGWISLPQGGVRGLLKIFDVSDPVHPRKIGSASIARCTTGVPMKVIVVEHYAVVASLLQGLVVVDLNAVIANSEKVDLELVGVSQVEPGITVPIAGPIGTSLTEDSADARCEPGRPQMVAGVWDASGQLRTPFDLKVYGAQALVGDYHAGTYRVYLDSLPAIDGDLVSADPTFRLDVLPNVEIVNTKDQSKRTTDIAVIASGKTLTLLDARDGSILGRASIGGSAFNVLVDSERRLVLVGTDSCVELFDITVLDNPVSRGCNPKINSATGGLAMLGSYVVASTAGGAVVVQIVQPPIDIKFYEAQDFGPIYDRNAQSLWFTHELTDIPPDGKEMVGAQADGVSLLVVRASIPDNSKAKEAILTVTTPQGNAWSAATFGGLYPERPSASAVRGAQGRQRVIVPIKEVKNGTKTERVAVAIYHPPTKFISDGDGPGASRRQVTVAVQTNEDHPLDGGRAVQVWRRPLILVHGYNSGPGTWDGLIRGLKSAEKVRGLTLMNDVRYEDINTYGLDMIYRRIPLALDNIRTELKEDSQISATRFDILAHSMGGLATWTYVSDIKDVLFFRNLLPALARVITRSEQDYFRRGANYGAGTINQVISIGTPYRGSDLADRILAFLKCTDTYQEIQGCAPRSLSDTLPQGLLEAFLRNVVTKWQGNGDRSAYADLAASSLSDETSALGRLWGSTPTGVPVHTIAGIAYDSVGCQESLVEVTRMGWTLPYGSSDLIVDRESATGGLKGDSSEVLSGVCHTQETGVRLILDRPGQPAPLPPLINDLTSDGKFYLQGLPAR